MKIGKLKSLFITSCTISPLISISATSNSNTDRYKFEIKRVWFNTIS
nr:hypothetical protein [Mycoplasmopsis bovis]